ncbi:DUF4398 domain-containing protein [bacterium]|nr:DUF4398 domain-containing protein [bacterium]
MTSLIPKARKKEKLLEVRWIPISSKTVALIFIPFLILVVGGLVYLYLSSGNIVVEAQTALNTAKIAIDNAIKAGGKQFAKDKIKIAEDLYESAVEKLDQKDYRHARDMAYQARAKAAEVERIAKYNSTNAQKPRYARIQSVDGMCEISKTNGNSWQPAKSNTFLYEGNIVRTYASANISIIFEDDSVIRIYPDSYVILSDLYKNATAKDKKTELKFGYTGSAELRAETKSDFKFYMRDLEINAEKNSDIKAKIDSTGMTGIEVYRGKVKGTSANNQFELMQREKITIDPARKHFEKGSIPFSPIAILPVSMSLFSFPDREHSLIEVRWSKVDNASKYKLQVATDFFFSNVIFEKEISSKTSFVLKNLEPNNYFWQVNSIDKEGIESEYCNYRIFKIIFGPEKIENSQDKVSPTIDINFINVYGDVVDISGTTEPDAILVVNGKIEKIETDGSFRVTYTHSFKGIHHIIIEAIDSTGNHSKVVKNVNIDY